MSQIFGWTATILLAICAFPQIVKSIKTKSVNDLSSLMWLIFLIGHLFALTYAILIGEAPLMAKYIFNIILSSFLLAIYLKYK